MITININGLTLCHKGSGGVTHNTLPDVCKTPPFAVPVPYDNEAYSADLTNGTSSVFADGGNMIANFGSKFARSVFDESGSMGGIKSGTNRAEADWISHSFNVFFEGQPACRLTDKMFMNHHNTVNMAGLCQADLTQFELIDKICEAICKCRNLIAQEFRKQIDQFFSAPALGLAQEMMKRFLSDDSELPQTVDKGLKTGPRQQCFAKEFNQKGTIPWYGATPQDPCYLTEVPYKIFSKDLITSGSGRTTYSEGPTAPASVRRALGTARQMGKEQVVIWDLVALKDPGLTAEWDNIHQIIEIKFEGDEATKNQKIALNAGMQKKVRLIYEKECGCDDKDDREKVRMRQKVEEFIRKLSESAAKTFGIAPGGGPIPLLL
ncbi:DUF4150 domain-containing protein [Rahnella ecdela]|uniref:DUF4150 domain-containing protein n=1 Tax=Rahnella ecdela TaxID=2816250 RepID=UPI001EE583EC|nr:DUF4150 domain-containing protein [Rahnella ecdela]